MSSPLETSPPKELSAEIRIESNLIFCASVGIPLFIIFCLIRSRFRSIYAPNVLNTKKYVHTRLLF